MLQVDKGKDKTAVAGQKVMNKKETQNTRHITATMCVCVCVCVKRDIESEYKYVGVCVCVYLEIAQIIHLATKATHTQTQGTNEAQSSTPDRRARESRPKHNELKTVCKMDIYVCVCVVCVCFLYLPLMTETR